MTAPMERIQVLDSIEKDIITCLHSAGMTITLEYAIYQVDLNFYIIHDILFTRA